MPIPTSGALRLSCDIHCNYVTFPDTIPGFTSSYRYNSYHGTGITCRCTDMSRLNTGVAMRDSAGNKTAAYDYFGYGRYPYSLPFGTFKIPGSRTDYFLRNSTTPIPALTSITSAGTGNTPYNVKMSDFYGSFWPYYGTLGLTTA